MNFKKQFAVISLICCALVLNSCITEEVYLEPEKFTPTLIAFPGNVSSSGFECRLIGTDRIKYNGFKNYRACIIEATLEGVEKLVIEYPSDYSIGSFLIDENDELFITGSDNYYSIFGKSDRWGYFLFMNKLHGSFFGSSISKSNNGRYFIGMRNDYSYNYDRVSIVDSVGELIATTKLIYGSIDYKIVDTKLSQDGGFYTLSAEASNNNSSPMLIQKWQDDGTIDLELEFRPLPILYPRLIEENKSQNLVIAGNTQEQINSETIQSVTIYCISHSGNVLWETNVKDTVQSIACDDMILDENDNLYIISSTNQYYNHLCTVTKISEKGELVWSKTFPFEEEFYPTRILLKGNDELLVMGRGEYQSALFIMRTDGTFD